MDFPETNGRRCTRKGRNPSVTHGLDTVPSTRYGVKARNASHPEEADVAGKDDRMTLPQFAAAHGFRRHFVWRMVRENPSLAVAVPHRQTARGFRYEVLDSKALAAVVRTRLARKRVWPAHYKRRQPPPGQRPAGEVSDGTP